MGPGFSILFVKAVTVKQCSQFQILFDDIEVTTTIGVSKMQYGRAKRSDHILHDVFYCRRCLIIFCVHTARLNVWYFQWELNKTLEIVDIRENIIARCCLVWQSSKRHWHVKYSFGTRHSSSTCCNWRSSWHSIVVFFNFGRGTDCCICIQLDHNRTNYRVFAIYFFIGTIASQNANRILEKRFGCVRRSWSSKPFVVDTDENLEINLIAVLFKLKITHQAMSNIRTVAILNKEKYFCNEYSKKFEPSYQ